MNQLQFLRIEREFVLQCIKHAEAIGNDPKASRAELRDIDREIEQYTHIENMIREE